MTTYKSFLATSAFIMGAIGMRFIALPSLASIQGLMGSIAAQYTKNETTQASAKIARQHGFSAPSSPAFLKNIIEGIDDSEIKFLMGNPEEDMLTMPVDLYQDKPELAALVPQDNSVEGKNFWFDRYNYYSQLYEPEHHQSLREKFDSFQDATPEQNAVYLQMLADLEIPYRKPLKTYPEKHAQKENSFAFTYDDQIAICGDLPFEYFRTTLYHEGQHLKYHDSVKLLLLRVILYTQYGYSDQQVQQTLADCMKFNEHRADYSTYHNYINCYKCSLAKADFIKDTGATRIEQGYISYEDLAAICKEQENNHLLCAHHQSTLQQTQSV